MGQTGISNEANADGVVCDGGLMTGLGRGGGAGRVGLCLI
jgi:hypothetical protein